MFRNKHETLINVGNKPPTFYYIRTLFRQKLHKIKYLLMQNVEPTEPKSIEPHKNKNLVSGRPTGPGPARIWFATIPCPDDTQFNGVLDRISANTIYSKGQLETGASGYKHIQCVFWTGKPVRLGWCKKNIDIHGHFEHCKSDAGEQYCSKSDTRVLGTQFEFGKVLNK